MNAFALFALTFLWPMCAIAESIPMPSSTLLKKSYRIQWDSHYFQSDSTVNFEGIEEIFPMQQKFIRWDNDIALSYGLNERFEPSIGIRYRFKQCPPRGYPSQRSRTLFGFASNIAFPSLSAFN